MLHKPVGNLGSGMQPQLLDPRLDPRLLPQSPPRTGRRLADGAETVLPDHDSRMHLTLRVVKKPPVYAPETSDGIMVMVATRWRNLGIG
jgi:hypothetical protein